jgi:hypothetical protein
MTEWAERDVVDPLTRGTGAPEAGNWQELG